MPKLALVEDACEKHRIVRTSSLFCMIFNFVIGNILQFLINFYKYVKRVSIAVDDSIKYDKEGNAICLINTAYILHWIESIIKLPSHLDRFFYEIECIKNNSK